ncbi:hypothetical protein BLS_003403 [Venturia inaequalis]|uniref:Uncharacterized protein n=1 Tax=Venturia inaequalis TaxID=5025 RepID=A0A8H3YVX0_VENIN|nr:hypothetical protein BLS_003403 [Venturia inaequalis]RDI89635.1 hypothetical protein Vi05172_g266 [Venturia inaequalis]
MSTSPTPTTPPEILAAARALSECLQYIPYALVGGAAYSLLDSPCSVDAIELVVPRGQTLLTRNTLKKDTAHFEVDPRTRHTHFKGQFNIEISIVAPPGLFRGKFESGTRVVKRHGVSILHPSLLLNELCGIVKERLNEGKMEEDAADILFLLSWLGNHEEKVRWGDVPNVTRAFAAWFVGKYRGEELWRKLEKKMVD